MSLDARSKLRAPDDNGTLGPLVAVAADQFGAFGVEFSFVAPRGEALETESTEAGQASTRRKKFALVHRRG